MKNNRTIYSLSVFLKERGFLKFVGNPIEESNIDHGKDNLCSKRPAVHSTPVCFERTIHANGYLYIEGFKRIRKSGFVIGYRYDFYRLSTSSWRNKTYIKVYGENLTQSEVMKLVSKWYPFLERG